MLNSLFLARKKKLGVSEGGESSVFGGPPRKPPVRAVRLLFLREHASGRRFVRRKGNKQIADAAKRRTGLHIKEHS